MVATVVRSDMDVKKLEDSDHPDSKIDESGHQDEDSSSKVKEIEENTVYITGFKLYAVIGSVTLTAFLMFLDMSILGTV
jgi:hypothetical protein